MNEMTKLSIKDFETDQEVRWCPGCGDYAILKAVQRTMPELGVRPENVVFVSGIGCSSRFPYYMETYGFHTIHGRAPAVATGVKLANPELDVWIRSEEHTSELQSLMRISYAVFCLKKKNINKKMNH